MAAAITSSRSAATSRPISIGSTRIAAVLDRDVGDYRATLDGNEQYDSVEGIAELWRRMARDAGAEAARRCDPVHRAADQARGRAQSPGRSARARASADHRRVGWRAGRRSRRRSRSAMPASRARTARASTSRCSTPRAWRSSMRAAGSARYFMSGEDLTTWAGVSVQQDLALVSLLGLTHVERNGHHFIDGMGFAPEREQRAFVAAHPDLYAKERSARAPAHSTTASCGSARSDAPASPSPPRWILPRCDRCRRRRKRRSLRPAKRRLHEAGLSMAWRIGVDIGGTFTDVALVDDASGRIGVAKVPTTPDRPRRRRARAPWRRR